MISYITFQYVILLKNKIFQNFNIKEKYGLKLAQKINILI